MNAKRVAVATAYTDEVTARLKVFLEEHGYEVTSTQGLGFVSFRRARLPTTSCSSWRGVLRPSQKADALVVSCGRLNTLDLLAPLEGNIRVPVVSSTPHGLMNGVRLLKTCAQGQRFRDRFAKA